MTETYKTTITVEIEVEVSYTLQRGTPASYNEPAGFDAVTLYSVCPVDAFSINLLPLCDDGVLESVEQEIREQGTYSDDAAADDEAEARRDDI